MTVYFKPEHFKTSLPVAITSMLVMYTLNQSISAGLPATSYIKFIDIGLLFGLIQPFFIIIMIVLIDSKGNSHSWDIFSETWDMTPCFRATIPGSWMYILVKKFRSQVRLFGKNQVYLVEVITNFLFFDTLSLRLI